MPRAPRACELLLAALAGILCASLAARAAEGGAGDEVEGNGGDVPAAPALSPSVAVPADGGSVEQQLRELRRRLSELESRAPGLGATAAVPPSNAPLTQLSGASTPSGPRTVLTVGGYVEAFYQWNFNQPGNDITSYRGFDDRHNSFTIANAVLDAVGAVGPVSAHLALQIGRTPEIYYLAEPTSRGLAGAGSSGPSAWKLIQQANLGWNAPVGRGLLLEAGIFLSPLTPEGLAIKDQWNWSRSNLFFGLPAYHSGFRGTYAFTGRLSGSVMICNGWNSVVDNNPELSGSAQLTYSIPNDVTLNLVYFTGVERPRGAPEGRAWRHTFDAYVAWYPTKSLALLVHGDAGFEPNLFGTSGWAAAALYGRYQLVRWLYVAARVDYFWERPASSSGGAAAPIFWPVSWVSSATATLDTRPADQLSVRLEYRHDQAAGLLYFLGGPPLDASGNGIPNARSQDTLLLGATAWF